MEGISIRPAGTGDAERFVQQAREEVYPFLSSRRLSEWRKQGFPVRFILEREGVLVGGIAFDVYDMLDREVVVLSLDILFINLEFQGQGLGQHLLLEGLRLANEYYCRQYSWRVVGILIETTDAAGFYEKALSRAGYCFSKMEVAYPELGTTVTYLHVIIPSEETKPE